MTSGDLTPQGQIPSSQDLEENLLFVTARSGGSYYLLHPKSLGNLLIKILDVEKEKKYIYRYKFQSFHELLNTSI
jgi:hypothetical protein